MGNFSVSHYASPGGDRRGDQLVYALDLAEIPTFDLLRSWKLDRNSPRALLESKASEQARLWLSQLQIQLGSAALAPGVSKFGTDHQRWRWRSAGGADHARAHLDAAAGSLAYEDLNFPDRAGWKEIVIVDGPGAALRQASQSSTDVTQGLTRYPPDPTVGAASRLAGGIDPGESINRKPCVVRLVLRLQPGDHSDSTAHTSRRRIVASHHDTGSGAARQRRARRFRCRGCCIRRNSRCG